MNQYGVLKLAREAGLLRGGDGWTMPHRWGITEIERFAALVAEPLQERIRDLYRQLDEAEKRLDEQYKMGMEAEREVCAEMVEDMDVQHPKYIAAAIRARGEE